MAPLSVSFNLSNTRHRLPIRSHLPPPVTTIAAVCFLLVGLIFLPIGISEYFQAQTADDTERGRNMVAVGTIAFLPGSYSTFMLFAAYRQWPGYSYSQVPNYDAAWFGLDQPHDD